MSDDRIGDATYSPEDDKLRLRAFSRLDREDYDRAKRAGFRWAPKQELFYAAWSPVAEDLLTEWCGEIQPEETTLEDRAEERAERFATYSAKRERDGDRAQAAVAEIADAIPLGQPILVGHHSEKRARKDAERIENGMRRAVKMWRTAEYWQQRAAGVKAHASYVSRPAVRARRIKTLEAERRKRVASYTPHGPPFETEPGRDRCRDRHPYGERCDECKAQPCVWVGPKGRGCYVVATAWLPGIEERQARWIEHLDLRLAYERALLDEQGAAHLLEKKKRPTAPPLPNYRSPGGIEVRNIYRGTTEFNGQEEMTRAEYAKIHSDYKGTRLSADGSHRVRSAMRHHPTRLVLVFLTDSKEHPRPERTA